MNGSSYYYIQLVFRFNQDDTFPACFWQIHRIAITDFYEIYTGAFHTEDLPAVQEYVDELKRGRNLVSSYFEYVPGGLPCPAGTLYTS